MSKSWTFDSTTLNINDSSTMTRSRTESISSQHSTQSFPGTFEMLSSGDMFDDFGWGGEFSPFHSQDLSDELSQGSVTSFKSTSSLSSDNELDGYFNDSTQSSQFSISSSSVEIDKSNVGLTVSPSPIKIDRSDDREIEEVEGEDGWMTVGSKKKNWGRLNLK